MLGFERFRVVEVGTAVSVPMVGAVLANLGAEVIKVESRRRPDLNRARVPKTEDGSPDQQETFPLLHDLNPGKKSVTLDLKHPAGRDLFERLLGTSDVFIENYVPGWLDRLGLPLSGLLEACPRLVVLAASAYGEEGPYARQRAYAPIMTGLAGVEGLVGYRPDDVVGMVATAFSDPNAAYFGVLAVLAALLERDRSGRGCLVDLSQTEAAACLAGIAFAEYELSGTEPRPRGNAHPEFVPHDMYRCAGEDQWVSLAVTSEEQWSRLRARCDVPRLRESRFDTVSGRRAARAELDALITGWTSVRTVDEVVTLLRHDGIPVAPVSRPEDLDETEPFVTRGLSERVWHPSLGEMRVTATPWHFGDRSPRPSGAGPILGSATRDVLAGLGVGDAEYARLDADGAFH